MTHTPVCDDCGGCLAKTRAKPHFRKAFKKDDPKYTNTITMDQVTIRDEFGTAGLSGYRYGIVLYYIGKQFWSFVPLRTLVANETEFAFRAFCLTVGADYSCALVYCDCHASLVKVCNDVGVLVRHPPPARPQANAVIERLVGLYLQGIRAYLTTAGMPNCFWPFAGRCFCLNYNCEVRGEELTSSYEKATGAAPSFETYVLGELIFFKHAPTIKAGKPGKVENPLRAGVFLHYYITPAGQLFWAIPSLPARGL